MQTENPNRYQVALGKLTSELYELIVLANDVMRRRHRGNAEGQAQIAVDALETRLVQLLAATSPEPAKLPVYVHSVVATGAATTHCIPDLKQRVRELLEVQGELGYPIPLVKILLAEAQGFVADIETGEILYHETERPFELA